MKRFYSAPVSVIPALILVMILIPAALFAGGNKEVPQIPPISSGTQYLSPNDDGVKDEATISFSVKIYVKSKEGYVPEYGLQISDEAGKALRQIVEKEKRDIGFFAALFSGYKEFTLEREVTWNGLDESGQPFPDGSYNLSVWVVDANGNRQETSLDDFVIDTTPPSAKVTGPEKMLFSPNGDGNLDTFSISHVEATSEEEWTGEIRDASGTVVLTKEWSGTPEDFVWDGNSDSGEPAPEGIYSYVLESTDLAGNDSGEIVLSGVELSRLETSVDLVIDPEYISPNGDGVQDSATVYLDRSVAEGVTGWRWAILDQDGDEMIGASGEGEPPLEVLLDGRDKDGATLAEGSWRFFHQVEYENGNRPSAEESFVVDVTPPEVTVTVEHPVLSPDGDGRKDETRIQFESNEKVTWTGAILSPSGESLMETDSSQTTSLVVWDGRGLDGELGPEGEYTLLVGFTDLAGNTTYPMPKTVVLDVSPVELALNVPRAFSPNGDGKNDFLPIDLKSNQYRGVSSWNLRLVDESGTTVQEYGGSGELPAALPWDGSVSAKDDFSAAPEGRYRARARVVYDKGMVVEAASERFLLDTTPPVVQVAVTSSPFAETDEGVEGEVFVTVKATDNDGIAGWSMELLDEKGDVLRVYDGQGDPSGDITWNKKENVKAPKLDASRFTIKIRVTDEGGNITVYSEPIPLDMLLVKKDGRYYLSVPNVIFGAYQHELSSAGPEMLKRNKKTLDRVVNIYQRYPSYDLLLEGHALNIYRGTGRETREEEILQPLTERRGSTVKDALIQRGMERQKIGAEAYGGRFPNADVTDESLWWKVRRVEFVMVPPAGQGEQAEPLSTPEGKE